MKQLRIRFKSRKKFMGRFNAQFKKLTAGFCTYHKATVNRDKTRQPQEIQSGKHTQK